MFLNPDRAIKTPSSRSSGTPKHRLALAWHTKTPLGARPARQNTAWRSPGTPKHHVWLSNHHRITIESL
jgi:hypothetical protein